MDLEKEMGGHILKRIKIFNLALCIAAIVAVNIIPSCVKSGQAIENENNQVNSEKQEEKSAEEKEKESIEEKIKLNEDNLLILCNKELKLPEDYVPEDLVNPNIPLVYPTTAQQSKMRAEAATALELMFEEANKAGLKPLYLVSGFRTYEYQNEIYTNSVNNRGQEYTDRYMAKPGHSEHQTGLVADISTQEMNFGLEESFDQLAEGQWLAENAHRFGFILRYPKDRIEDTGYNYESWHFRYVGVETSTYMKKNNLILEDVYKELDEKLDAVG